MGVRLLQTFLEQYCPDACHRVRIEDLAKEYRSSTGRDPVMVVDGSSCVRHLYGDLDWVCGGQSKEYVDRIKKFIQKFEELGIKLVVYYDGVTQSAKRPLWVRRRLKSMNDVHEVIDMLKYGMAVKNIPKQYFALPAGMISVMSSIIEETCEVHRSLRECDEEIAEYAQQNDCFAILGQDTDFVIYEGGRYYLSVQRLNLEDMTTLLYDRNALAYHLKIGTDQLPIFATLMGNDVIQADELKRFHKNITRGGGKQPYPLVLVHSVSSYVRSLPRGSELMNFLPELSRNVFASPNYVHILQQSILSYSVKKDSREGLEDFFLNTGELANLNSNYWAEVMTVAKRNHIEMLAPTFIFGLLHASIFEMSTSLEDYRLEIPCSAIALRPMRQRIYGVLLRDKPAYPGRSVTVEEWCMSGPHSLDNAAVVSAVMPPEKTPNLIELWQSQSPALCPARIELFAWIVSQEISSSILTSIPLQIIAAAVILFYLYNEIKVLFEWEVQAFAAAIVDQQAMSINDLAMLHVEKVDVRGIQLATLFMRSVTQFNLANAVCGKPFPKKSASEIFDGKLFQTVYLMAKKNPVFPRRGSHKNFNIMYSVVCGPR